MTTPPTSLQPTAIADDLERFLRETFTVPSTDDRFRRDVDLFEEGYVDSIGVTETIAYLERRYGVTVGEEDLLSEEFATIEGMAAIVSRKQRVNGERAGA
jgi:acyl carrier protein